jgi:hypothetical protein
MLFVLLSLALGEKHRIAVRGIPFVPSALERAGAELVDEASNWDVLWADDRVDEVPAGKLVNFVPGLGALTNKTTLATMSQGRGWTFMPPTNGPGWRVGKNLNHGGVHLMKSDVTDTTTQRLVEQPLLVDGVKFDLGVFALYYVDATHRLRAAVYTRDVLVRAATAPYPEGQVELDSTGVLVPSIDKYTPYWELPSLSAYPTAKEALDSTVGLEDVWPQVEAIVSSTLSAVHSKAVPFGVMQVVRFDLMLDAARKVWLIEINQSPRIHVPRAGDTTWRAALADDIAAYVLQLADGEAVPHEPWRVVAGSQVVAAGKADRRVARSLSESESASEGSASEGSKSESESEGSASEGSKSESASEGSASEGSASEGSASGGSMSERVDSSAAMVSVLAALLLH